MPYTARVFNVMIASPGDVQEERKIAREVILEWNAINSDTHKTVLQPIRWETHSTPDMGGRPQKIVTDQLLKQSDLLVAIFWTRFGTPTGEADSGTEEEIREHLKSGKPAMVYFSSAPISPDRIDQGQYQAVVAFKKYCEGQGLLGAYQNTSDFRAKFARELATKLNTHEYFKNRIENEPGNNTVDHVPVLSAEAVQLLAEACMDSNRQIDCDPGMRMFVNGKPLIEEGNAESTIIWEGALQELLDNDLIRDLDGGELFRVTRAGLEANVRRLEEGGGHRRFAQTYEKFPAMPDVPTQIWCKGDFWSAGPDDRRWHPMGKFTSENGEPGT
jgi:hypothetical protein